MLRTRPALTALGALLVLIALGLPWSAAEGVWVHGFITPSTCIPTADGDMWCSGGFVSPGFMVGGGIAAGMDTGARVFLVGALVLVAFAVHRASDRLLRVAGWVVLAGVVVTGPVLLAGPVAAVVGAVLLLRAARAADGTRTADARAGRTGWAWRTARGR